MTFVHRMWRGVGRGVWLLVKVSFYLVIAFVVSQAVLLLPAGVKPGGLLLYFGLKGTTFDLHLYWQALAMWRSIPAAEVHELLSMLGGACQLTGTLLLTSLLLSVLASVAVGYLLSRYAPRQGRRAAWATVTVLSALPDILLVVGLQLGLYLLGTGIGVRIPVYGPVGPMTLKYYILPIIALTLLPLPYLARVVASALEEAGGQRYVQAAMARGLPFRRVLWRHIGPNALIRILAAVPGVLGVLLSAEPVVEYMAEIHGLGWKLLEWGWGRVAALYLVPLLAAMILAQALVSAGQERLNPLQRTGCEADSVALERQSLWARIVALPGAIAEMSRWLWDQFRTLPTLPHRFWRAIRTNPTLLAGLLLAGGLLVVALAADHLAPYSWSREEVIRIRGEDYVLPPYPPNPLNWLGSDRFGRDVLSGIIYGTRYALLIAFMAVPVRFAIALPLGLAAAWRRGLTERIVRTLAAVFTSVPAVLLPLALVKSINSIWLEQRSMMILLGILVLALPGAPRLAEAIRLAAREVLHSPYLEGGRAVGASQTRLLLRYVLPNIAPTLTVLVVLEIPLVLTTTAFLGFRQVHLGGSLWDPDSRRLLGAFLPEWGSMLESPFLLFASGQWWLWAPFAALFSAVLAFTLLGEGIRRQTVTHQTWG